MEHDFIRFGGDNKAGNIASKFIPFGRNQEYGILVQD
jgi:hypothetical protein